MLLQWPKAFLFFCIFKFCMQDWFNDKQQPDYKKGADEVYFSTVLTGVPSVKKVVLTYEI